MEAEMLILDMEELVESFGDGEEDMEKRMNSTLDDALDM